METFLFDKIIFGPVKSRRLGNSLGINLLPIDSKLCNFDCVYCECGWTDVKSAPKLKVHTLNEIKAALENKLILLTSEGEMLNSITFAGNGEPTMHPEFDKVIDLTIKLRDKYYPDCPISVLSNSMMLHKTKVFDALQKIENPILKLDAGKQKTFDVIDRPVGNRKLDWVVDQLLKFKGNLIIQTMFLKGEYKGDYFDNTTDSEVECWIEIIKKVDPKLVMLYTIDRNTPADKLEKVDKKVLEQIANKVENLGVEAQVNYRE